MSITARTGPQAPPTKLTAILPAWKHRHRYEQAMVTPARAVPARRSEFVPASRSRRPRSARPTFACEAAASRSWRALLEPPPADASTWPSLTSALCATRARARRDRRNALDFARAAAHRSAPDRVPAGARRGSAATAVARRIALLRQCAHAADRRRVGGGAPRARQRRRPVVAAAAPARLDRCHSRAARSRRDGHVGASRLRRVRGRRRRSRCGRRSRDRTSYALIAHDDRTDLLQIDDGRSSAFAAFAPARPTRR